MKSRHMLSLAVIFLVASPVLGSGDIGVITSVEKDQFTIQSDFYHKPVTYKIGDDVKQGKGIDEGKPEDLKKGTKVLLEFKKEGDTFICRGFRVLPPPIGPCEIDFSALAVGTSVPRCNVAVRVAAVKEGFQKDPAVKPGDTINASCVIPADSSVSKVRDIVKGLFSKDWKVKPVGDEKLVIESYGDIPPSLVEIKAIGLPKGHDPVVRSLDSKDKEK